MGGQDCRGTVDCYGALGQCCKGGGNTIFPCCHFTQRSQLTRRVGRGNSSVCSQPQVSPKFSRCSTRCSRTAFRGSANDYRGDWRLTCRRACTVLELNAPKHRRRVEAPCRVHSLPKRLVLCLVGCWQRLSNLPLCCSGFCCRTGCAHLCYHGSFDGDPDIHCALIGDDT